MKLSIFIKKIVSTSVFVLFTIQAFYAQINFNKVKLDSFFDALEQNNKFMGSIALSKNGEVLYKRAVGFLDIENKIKANENSKYRIGSITKTFTAVLILKAIEQKKLSLNQTINKWFPTIKNANKITINNLLNHRSGIHNFTNDEPYLTYNTKPKTEKEMIDIISKAGSDFIPDSKADYSNSNYVLLTYILEKTYKKSYANLLQEFITKPLGLKSTYVFGKINTKNNECKSYSFSENWKLETETHFSIPQGAGSIISTPSDLIKFADAIFAGKLISANSLIKMKTMVDNFGLGLFQIPFNNKIGFGHTGGIDGFSSVFCHFPDNKISYALTSNGTNFNNNDISIIALSAANGLPFELPNFKSILLTTEELEKYTGVYASKEIPLKITVSREGNTLKAQATGQSAFMLEATEKDKFKFDAAGIKIEFNTSDNTMILMQGGAKFKFTKE